MSDDKPKSLYAETWDSYVTEEFPRIATKPARTPQDIKSWQVLNTTDESYAWPGDEWGDAEAVTHILDTCVAGYLDDNPAHLCELASGAGRFTAAVLERYPEAGIDCFDISQEFLDQMERRFADRIALGQMRTTLLTANPKDMYRSIARSGLERQVDGVFSFDAMVHVDLHSILIYIVTAAAVLKPGGLLSMNVADASNPRGLQKLLFNAPAVFRRGGTVGPHFQFAAPDSLRAILELTGFSCDMHDCNGRDLFFSARLEDPEAAARAFRDAGSAWWVGA